MTIDKPAIVFDKAIWLARAAERAAKARARNKLPARVRSDLVEDNRAIDDLATLIAWLNDQDVNVSFSPTKHDGLFLQFGPFPKIMVNTFLLPRNQLFVLLHEAGHWLVPKRLKVRFAHGYAKAAHPHQTAKLIHRVDVLDEELEAWWQGQLLAQKLKLASFDEGAYATFKAKRIASYCSWLTRSGPFKKTHPKVKKLSKDDEISQFAAGDKVLRSPEVGVPEQDVVFVEGSRDDPDALFVTNQEGVDPCLQ